MVIRFQKDEPLFLSAALMPVTIHQRCRFCISIAKMCIQDGCTDYQVAGNDKMILEFEKVALANIGIG